VRLSTRFGIGAALAMLPLVAVSVYSVNNLRSLARANERLTERHLIGLQIGLGVVSRLERLEEYWRKYTVSQDAGYVGKFEETLQVTLRELDGILRAELSSGEEQALREFTRELSRFAAVPSAERAESPDEVFTQIGQLTKLASAVHDEARRIAQAEADAAAEVRETTQRAAFFAACAAAAASLILILLTVRSLRLQLRPLVRGTHAVSQGAFSVRLPVHADDELGHVADAFNHMVDGLQQLERIKADFISSVSHELRTPLVAMIETNRLLLEDVLGPLNEKQRRLLRINTQAAQRLSNMITDLLELSRLKAQIHYEVSEQELTELTRAAVSELEALARDRGVSLTTALGSTPLRVRCDPDRYVQVVQNLVENAIKYTPAGGRIRVSLGPCQGRDVPRKVLKDDAPQDYALLSVEDSGPGIPPEDRQRVFEKFFRRQGVPSDEGVGLGLAICREVVEAHAGTVWLGESEDLGGTAARVALPLDVAARAPRALSA
jgi:signal transduction histidine kinase